MSPASKDPIRWGIAGTGKIASSFAAGLAELEDASLVAVASRSVEGAEAFGARFAAPHRHASYEALAEDPDVDVVYVASPHHRHEADALLYLAAGKPVLCEKAFALDAAQSERMIGAARDRGLFLMEAMWSRFLPSYRTLVDLVASGRIGEPRLVEADFGFRAPLDPSHRLFDLGLGGGALLDLGVYPIQLSSLVLGPPDRIAAVAHLGETGADEQVAAVLHHPAGTIGVVKAAIRTALTCTARIAGTEGSIALPAFMHACDHLTVTVGRDSERMDCPIGGQGLRFEAIEVQRCLREGLTESPVMPQAETLSIMRTMDEIRAQIGLVYPS